MFAWCTRIAELQLGTGTGKKTPPWRHPEYAGDTEVRDVQVSVVIPAKAGMTAKCSAPGTPWTRWTVWTASDSLGAVRFPAPLRRWM